MLFSPVEPRHTPFHLTSNRERALLFSLEIASILFSSLFLYILFLSYLHALHLLTAPVLLLLLFVFFFFFFSALSLSISLPASSFVVWRLSFFLSFSQELSEKFVQAFLSRLAVASVEARAETSAWAGGGGGGGSAGGGVSWRELQELIQQEEFDNRVEQIEQMEDDIIQVLGRELDFVLSIGDKEKEFSSLEATFQTQVN